jgi:hypothetical protein
MLVSDEEYEELKSKFDDDADWTDEEQLAEIGVDYSERLLEYLIYEI